MSEANVQQIPPTWEWVELDKLGDWAGGGTPSKDNPHFWTNGTTPWVSPKDMKTFEIFDADDHITETAIENSATAKLPKDAILMVTRSGILRHTFPVAVARVPVALNQDLKALIPESALNPAFIARALVRFSQNIIHSCSKDGTTVQSIETGSLKRFKIPLAPVEEQSRILDKLDELLSDLDAGVAALERVRSKITHYRAAVLKAAVEGALTADWRAQHPDIESATDLLARILAERRQRWEEAQLRKFQAQGKTPPKDWKSKYQEPAAPDTKNLPGLPEGWCWATVEQLLSSPIINGLSIKGSEMPPGIAALRLNAMSDSGFDYTKRRYLPLEPKDVDDLWIEEGDFFVSRGNGSKKLVGRGTLAQAPEEKVIFPDTMMRLRFSTLVRGTNWMRVTWMSHIIRQQIETVAKTTAGIWKIAQPDLARMAVPLPPLAEQLAIVEAVEAQLSVIDHLEADLEAKLKSAQALRQSILRDAFEGKLVPQDPDDEPATELLQRIAAERDERAAAAKAAKAFKKPAIASTGRGRRRQLNASS